MKITHKATLYLLFVTASWGLTFPLMKEVMTVVSPAVFVVARFFIASLVLFPFVMGSLKKTPRSILLAGLALGTINSAIYVLQSLGVQTISSSQSAFIVGASVVFVPFLSKFFGIKGFNRLNIISAIICLIGLLVFTDFAVNLRIGSFWCMLSALIIAINIVLLQIFTQRAKFDCKLLVFYQILFTIPAPLLFVFHDINYVQLLRADVIVSVLFCAIMATMIAFMLQTKYQHYIEATKAALIYSLEPVFACLFGLVLFNDTISINMIIGGSIMLFGLSLSELLALIFPK